MATGRLAANDLVGGSDTTVYSCPADTYTVASCTITNRGTQPAVINIAVALSGTPELGEYIEYETELLPKNVLERTGLVLGATQNVVVRSNVNSISCVMFGIETSTV